MRRRALLSLGALAVLAPVLSPVLPPVLPVRAQSVVGIGGPMAGSVFFTRDDPGLWASEAERHLPEVRSESAPGASTAVTIRTPHPMDGFRHYILKHKLLDARFRLISQKTFDPGRDQPVSRHVLPAGYQGPVYAVSICNLHDTWIEGVMIGGTAVAPPP